MTQIMNATETALMTDGQIENAVSKLRDAMRKHRAGISSEAAQQVLGVENLGMLMFAPFRERVEAISNLIIVPAVVVDCGRSPQQALEATGRVQYTDRKVVENMPKAPAVLVEIIFFKPDLSKRNGRISDNDLEKEYTLRGLEPVDPISLAALNEAAPAFADETPHGTHWKDVNDKWCFATFHRWSGKRSVNVNRHDNDWDDYWWFAGVRK
jgi:hypothetical protein